MTLLQGSYYIPLVVLSVSISVLASYCSIVICERMLSTRGEGRGAWLLLGAAAMGLGIWAMHFIGMLAYHLPLPFHYRPGWLVVSIILPVLAAGAAFWMIASRVSTNRTMLLGSCCLTVAIVGMHYSGMAAIAMPLSQHYNPWLVAASCLIAFCLSFAALKLASRSRTRGRAAGYGAKALLAIALGAAIAGMHYTGMAAVSFGGMEAFMAEQGAAARELGDDVPLAGLVGGAALFILLIVLAGEILDKRFALRLADSSKRRYDSIFELHPDMVCLYDAKGRILRANPAALRITGYTAEELPNRMQAEMVNVPELEQLKACFMAALQGESGTVEFNIRRKDGQPLRLSCTMVPWVEDGRVQDVYTISKDITRARQSELELLEAKRAAEEALRIKSEFLAVMSHEIRTPLNGVLGMSAILLETELSPEQREFVEVIQGSGSLLLSTINDVLDYSKLEAGKMQPICEPFHLEGLVRDTVQLFHAHCRQKGLELLWRIGDGLPQAVVGDAQRVCQVLVNLIGNAVKFTARGTIEVAVETAGGGERAAGEERGNRVRFSVRDTGIGIAGEEQAHLFQPFYQAAAAGRKRREGTGLGLAICKDLVELMGGTISVESVPGAGSRFMFELPLQPVELAETTGDSQRRLETS